MNRTITTLLLATIATLATTAQNKKREQVRSVTYTMAFPDDVSPQRAMSILLEQAQIEAVAQAFGTVVTMSTELTEGNVGGKSYGDFCVKSTSDVRGEWIETIGKPEWTRARNGDRLTEYTVRIKGRVREWNTETAELDVLLLRNGVDTLLNKSRDLIFYSKDDFYLYFRSPQSGFLAIYATKELGEGRMAQRLLPYPGQTSEAYTIQADRDYYFFSKEKSWLDRNVVSLKMDCKGDEDVNKVYVIFSPTPFIKAADAANDLTNLNHLALPDFHRWLSNRRRKDPYTQVRSFAITIKKG